MVSGVEFTKYKSRNWMRVQLSDTEPKYACKDCDGTITTLREAGNDELKGKVIVLTPEYLPSGCLNGFHISVREE
jgi:hypothetical protein